MDFLLNNLKDLLIDHIQLITSTKTHIVSLEADLRKFKGFLKDSLKQRRKDEETKALVRSIRDVVYDVEDVIDAFITEAKEKSKSKGRFYNFWKTPMELHNIGQMVAEVKAKVDKATTDLVNRKLLDDDEPRSGKAKYQVT